MKKFDPGKWAESEVEKWLDLRANKRLHFAYHRFPDARAARGALASQPCDFLAAEQYLDMDLGQHTWFIEVKETKNERRLPKTKFAQFGRLKVFHLAGVKVLCLVWCSELQRWTWLDHNDLFFHEEVPASFPFKNDFYDNVTEMMKDLMP